MPFDEGLHQTGKQHWQEAAAQEIVQPNITATEVMSASHTCKNLKRSKHSGRAAGGWGTNPVHAPDVTPAGQQLR